ISDGLFNFYGVHLRTALHWHVHVIALLLLVCSELMPYPMVYLENFDRKFNRIEPSSVADSASDSCFTKPFYVFMLKFLALR
ncbi:hypothetical protein OFN55_32670, partial [Escherichia coli]|nr:hypothetical protein [Escherichia coli]